MTFTAFTICNNKDQADSLADALEKTVPAPFGVGVFEVEDGSNFYEIGSYFLERPSDIDLLLLSSVFSVKPFVISEVPQTDWVAHVKRELPPVEVGRFSILGSHNIGKASGKKVNLIIDAAMAFGTGHHATTKGCLLALEKLITDGFQPKSIIDLGTGTAVLAMAAAKVWDTSVLATDIDKVAVQTADANVISNQLVSRVLCIEADGFDHIKIQERAPFDLIFANILMAPLVSLAPDMTKLARKILSVAVLSGILNSQASTVLAKYKKHGWVCKDQLTIGDWTTIIIFLKL